MASNRSGTPAEETSSAQYATLAAKLSRISAKAEYIQKTRVNTAQNYKYVGEADYLELLKPLLAEERVAFLPEFTIHDIHEGTTKSGTATCRVTVICTASFLCGDTGAEVFVSSIGQGIDSQDKAPYKAMTGAIKYALAKTFLVATGDDPEEDEKAPQNAPPPQQQPQPINKDKWAIAVTRAISKMEGDDIDALFKKYAMNPATSYLQAFDLLGTDALRIAFLKDATNG